MTSLRQLMTEDMQVRNLSPQTQTSYIQQVSLFARHFNKSPIELGHDEIRTYQVYLTNEKKLAPSSILTAVSALRFLYRVTLHKDWSFEQIIPAPKKPETLPVVLSPEETLQFLDSVEHIEHRTILTACYAAGLRISEAIRLKATDIDSQRMVIRVEQGKAHKIATSCCRRHCWRSCAGGGAVKGPHIGSFQATIPANTSVRKPSRMRAKKHAGAAVSQNRSRRILSVTHLPFICSKAEPTSARSNSCSVIAA